MKGLLLGSLFLLGLGQGQSATDADAPSCVIDCAGRLSKQSGDLDLSTMCQDLIQQRTLFHCLMTSCHNHSYGAALGFTISTCLEFGADISPMAPVEIHRAVGTKRQVFPSELGPVVPGASPLFDTEVLGFDQKLALAIDCRSGSDGVVTLSIAGSNPAATPGPSSSSGGFRSHGVSQAPVMEPADPLQHGSHGSLGNVNQPDCNQSTALPSAHQTWCLCDVSSSSTVPYSFPSPFLTSLQVPIEHNTESFPLPTATFGSNDLMTPTSRPITDDCEETSTMANVTTVAPKQPRPSMEFSSAGQAPRVGTEDCSEPKTLQSQLRSSSFVGPVPTSFGNITTPAVQNQPLTTEATPCLNSSLAHDLMPASTDAFASSLSSAADLATNSSSVRVLPLVTTSVYSPKISNAAGEPCSNLSSVISSPLASSPTFAPVAPTVADEPCSNSTFIHTPFMPNSRTIAAPDSTISTPCVENLANSTLVDAQTRQSPVSSNCTTEAKSTMSQMHMPSTTKSLYPVSANTTSVSLVQPVSSPLSMTPSALQSSSWKSLTFQTPQSPLASSAFSSTLVNSTSLWPSFEISASGPPEYTTMAQPTLEAYLPPLPAYSYNSQLPEYSPANVVSPSSTTTQATMTVSTSSTPSTIGSSSSSAIMSPPPVHSAGQPDLYEGAIVGNDGDYGQEDGRNAGNGKQMALKHARGTPLDPTGRFAVLAMSQDDSQETMASSRPDMLGKLGASKDEADREAQALVLTAAGPPILKPSLLLVHGAMLLAMARLVEG